ncbi:MAG: hypothetical protein QOE61_1257, partial [Micromonosporaceae bacterium]|nr:hypothetical protein [Micromonosporaceae bacterium]
MAAKLGCIGNDMMVGAASAPWIG